MVRNARGFGSRSEKVVRNLFYSLHYSLTTLSTLKLHNQQLNTNWRMPSEAETNVEVVENGSGDGPKDAKAAELASQLMTDPAVLQEIQNKLSGMIGESSGYIKSLPKAVQRRIKALKKLQLEATMVEAEFHSEVHALECKYASRYSTINDKRRNIVGGAVEPTDEECEWPSSDEEEDDDETPKITEIKEAGEEEPEAETKGISSFWCTAIKNVEMLSHLIEDYDEPILENMTDIRTVLSEKPMGFTLEFHFTPNDYFENTVLTKWYEMKSEPDDDEPFSFDGPLIVSSKGCDIKWKPGKDVTVGEKKMKQKNKKTGNSRTVTKKVPQKSFFNFFKPPVVDDDVEADDVEEHEEALLQADYEFGQFMRDSLVPQAVLWFTGEASQGDDEDDDEDYEGDEDDDEYDEEADGDYDPSADPNAGKECKQQ